MMRLRTLLSSVAFTVIPEALLGESVIDKVHRYARVLCLYCGCLERRRWEGDGDGDGERVCGRF